MVAKPPLTKSRYKLGCECPTKLYYCARKDFANQLKDDPFMLSLAMGGYQVGELAKHLFPGGTEVRTLDPEVAWRETQDLLRRREVVIYEAALVAGNLLVRVDVLRKKGKQVELFEVKSKAIDPAEVSPFFASKGGLASNWRPYLEDIAFQKHVALNVFTGFKVSAHLVLVNRSAPCPSNGLNQKFRVIRAQGRIKGVEVSPSFRPQDLEGPSLLIQKNVDEECEFIYQEGSDGFGRDFLQRVRDYERALSTGVRIPPSFGPQCRGCEFQLEVPQRGGKLKDGREQCMAVLFPEWTKDDYRRPTVLDIWNYRKKPNLIGEGRIRTQDLREEDFIGTPRKSVSPGLSTGARQWLQVRMARGECSGPYVDREGLAAEMKNWTFPLHFIDFETSTVAIPFHKGTRPYETVAFQFSHHVMDRDGNLEHRTQYLDAEPGVHPNLGFARALMKALSNDQGTILRYAAHENSVLNQILEGLGPRKSREAQALGSFLESITSSRGTGRQGERSMVDMCALVKKYFLTAEMGGSNSIKAVLPAVLKHSPFLRRKYSQPVYGAKGGIKSLNFPPTAWFRNNGAEVMNPYDLLPPVFGDLESQTSDGIEGDLGELREGGAAMIAYARLQFEDLPSDHRTSIQAALLKYCELDTLAMVMIYEAWKDWTLDGNPKPRRRG